MYLFVVPTSQEDIVVVLDISLRSHIIPNDVIIPMLLFFWGGGGEHRALRTL